MPPRAGLGPFRAALPHVEAPCLQIALGSLEPPSAGWHSAVRLGVVVIVEDSRSRRLGGTPGRDEAIEDLADDLQCLRPLSITITLWYTIS